MAYYGEEIDCGGYVRRYYDEEWDYIVADDGSTYWRNKETHTTYESDGSFTGTLFYDSLGNVVDKFDDWDEDATWDDEEDNGC